MGGLYFLQEQLLFPRSVAAQALFRLPAGTETIELQAATGERLVGRLSRAEGASRGLLLGFPGNAWNADDCLTFLRHRLADVDIAVFHYRGYGPSEGEPGEAALVADAALIHDALRERLQPQRIFAAGFSLGSGVVAQLATARPLDGLILVTPFDSIEAVATARYAWAPVRPMLRHPFRSDRHLKGLDIPAAVIIAADDQVVPRVNSEALVQVLQRPVLVETVADATHGGIYDHPAIDAVLRRALDAIARG
ncbi:MAG: alpha/beta hydrolase [Geminicoccaceae bacterium]